MERDQLPPRYPKGDPRFNPRARMERDFFGWVDYETKDGFNPRARMERDFSLTFSLLSSLSFNPRARMERDSWSCATSGCM